MIVAAILPRYEIRVQSTGEGIPLKRRFLFGAVLGGAAALLMALPAQASTATSAVSPFADQGRAAGYSAAQLTALQQEVRHYQDLYGGRQTALNKIEFPGGKVLIPLPGEKRARELGAKVTAGSYMGCDVEWMCLFEYSGYSGTVVDQSRFDMWFCNKRPVYWNTHGSWVNNQTADTVGIFYHVYPDGHEGVWGYTGLPLAYQPDADWQQVSSVRNC